MSNNELVDPKKFLPPDIQKFGTDVDFAKKNLYDLALTGSDALAKLAQIADQSQNPRAFEVLAGLIKNLAEINEKLINASRTEKDEVKETTKETNDGKVVHNNLFVGSTAELMDLIKNKENDK